MAVTPLKMSYGLRVTVTFSVDRMHPIMHCEKRCPTDAPQPCNKYHNPCIQEGIHAGATGSEEAGNSGKCHKCHINEDDKYVGRHFCQLQLGVCSKDIFIFIGHYLFFALSTSHLKTSCFGCSVHGESSVRVFERTSTSDHLHN